jgi:DinB superfamily
VTITPDTKDWTWVLEGRCEECGLDAPALDPSEVPGLLRDVAATFAVVLADGEAARERPNPTTWSALEYACHVRDVCRRFEARLRLMLVLDDPVFDNWDQDAAAVQDAYDGQNPARVALEVTEAAARLADAIAGVPAEAWQRPGRRSDGVAFTVTTLTRYVAHDVVHHAHDVTKGRDRP